MRLHLRSVRMPLLAIVAAALTAVSLVSPAMSLVGPTTPTFQFAWGMLGNGPGQFNGPWGCATDRQGNVYVVDRYDGRVEKFDRYGHYLMSFGGMTGPLYAVVDSVGNLFVPDNGVVNKFDPNGNLLLQWGSYGSGDGQFQAAAGIALDPAGYVYVVDYQLNRMQKFTATGVYVTQWGTTGSGNGQFTNPTGICTDAAGNVYVADMGNNRIQEFSGAGAYLSQWGTQGTGDGQFANPVSISTDAFGNFYVSDESNHRVQKFSPTGAYLTQFGSFGSGDGQFNDALGTAVDAEGNVYVADFNNWRVEKFSSAGVPLSVGTPGYLLKWGSTGSGAGQFSGDLAVAVDPSGYVYVVESSNDRVQEFTSEGAYVTQWGSLGGGAGQFSSPGGIAVSAAGDVYVADTGNKRIQKFTSSGTYVGQWGSSGSGDGQFLSPVGIAVDAGGDVYVTDSSNDRVEKFSSSGTYIVQWGTPGTGFGEFGYPYGIAVGDWGTVYVGDSQNCRIEQFTSSGSYMTQWGSQGTDPGQFGSSFNGGLATAATGEVFAADNANYRIQEFASEGKYLTQWGAFGSANGSFSGQRLGVALDAMGDVYSSDGYISRVQKFATPPQITLVSDVAQDQGGAVHLHILRSSADVTGASVPIVRYDVYRRIAPLALTAAARKSLRAAYGGVDPAAVMLTGWDLVASLPATQSAAYDVVVPTLEDATGSTLYYSAFQVIAATADTSIYMTSATEYGYSLDNLAPPAPSPFTAAYQSGATYLHWGVSAAPDFATFHLYRGASAGFTPGPGNLIAAPTDTGYVDVGPAGSWYALSAVDVHGNEGPYSLVGPGQTAGVPPTAAPTFALDPVWPNPQPGGHLNVRFALPTTAPARLEVVDVAGRAVLTRDAATLGVGEHAVDLAAGRHLSAGLYFVRLTQGANAKTVRVAVLQ